MRKRIKDILQAELISPRTALAVSFITPAVAYLIMFLMRGVYPFGESTILGSDMYHQYGPFFSELRHKLVTGGSLFYSWNMGLGINFWALFVYYLSSPLNFLVVAVPQKYLPELMTGMIVVKIGLCGLSMTWYLRRHCRSYDFGAALFGILYAMSGYVTAYHWNVMWMDCIILFPLVVWGLEKLVQEKNGFCYCVLLGLSICSNYYISIMTCLFLVLYFPALLLMEENRCKKHILKACLRFAGWSLLAGGLAAVLLIPEILALRMTYAGNLQFPDLLHTYFSVFQVLERHLANVRAEYEVAHWPNIYCGVMVLLLVPLYLLCGAIRLRERLIYGSLAAVLLISFCLEPLDYIWHGLHFPNCFPARESYIYIFLMLMMSYQAYRNLGRIPGGRIGKVCLSALIFVMLAWRFPVETYFRGRSYILSGIYLSVYTICFMCYQKWEKLRHDVLLLLFAVLTVETLFTVTDNGMFDNRRSDYTRHDDVSRQMIKELRQKENFFRMKVTPADKANDGAWLHYPSMHSFSSTNYYSVYEVMHRLGCEAHPNYYSNNGATPLVDMMFGVGYEISFEEKTETDYRRMIKKEQDAWLYELARTLPVGFQAEDGISELFAGENSNPAELQNHIAGLFGAEPVLIDAGRAVWTEGGVKFAPEESGEYYAYIENNPDINKLYAEFPVMTKNYKTWTPGCLIDLGYCEKAQEIVIASDEPEELLQIRLFRFDGKDLAAIRRRLVKSAWAVERWTDTELEGEIHCQTDGIMMTTVPYDPGWNVWVDGQKQKPEQIMGAFMGVWLSSGPHSVRMHYTPPGIVVGGLISAVCFLALTVLWKQRKVKLNNQNDYIN